MRKIHRNSKLLALTLSASIATFGCTTNWNRSNGEPATGATSAGSPAATPGTSGGTIPQPMTSSSQITTRTPEQALAVMQQSLPTGQRGRYLGPVNPPNTGEARVGGMITPSFDGTIRQLTINSSISNPFGPQAAVISGAGGDVGAAGAIFGGAVAAPTVTSGATIGATTGVTAGATVAGTAATTGTATSITAATPTSASIPVTSGAFSAATGTLTPSASSAAVPSPTVATSPIVLGNTGMLSSSTVTNGAPATAVTAPIIATPATATAPITANATAPATAARASGTASIAPVRLNRGAITTTNSSAITVSQTAAGKIVISNVNK